VKHIIQTQKHSFGCGAACVAFIVGQSYTEIINILGNNKAQNVGFTCKELMKALSNLKHHYVFKYLKPRLKSKIYKNGVIVFIKRSLRYPAGHYLVYSNGQWMDSWKNFRATNFETNQADIFDLNHCVSWFY